MSLDLEDLWSLHLRPLEVSGKNIVQNDLVKNISSYCGPAPLVCLLCIDDGRDDNEDEEDTDKADTEDDVAKIVNTERYNDDQYF